MVFFCKIKTIFWLKNNKNQEKMATKSDISRFVVGEPVRCVCKLRVNTNYNKEDIKTQDRKVQLVDSQNRRKWPSQALYRP